MAVFEIILALVLIMLALDAGIFYLSRAKKMTGSSPVMMRDLVMCGSQKIIRIHINPEMD